MMFQPRTQVKPPDKGSFPLDHDGECKESMETYMRCLKRSGNDISACRQESKQYLECRMDHNLMRREDWKKLGFADLEEQEKSKKK